ncbi:MAG: serine hydrolase domain-containing protein [Chloroflexota bacterium]
MSLSEQAQRRGGPASRGARRARCAALVAVALVLSGTLDVAPARAADPLDGPARLFVSRRPLDAAERRAPTVVSSPAPRFIGSYEVALEAARVHFGVPGISLAVLKGDGGGWSGTAGSIEPGRPLVIGSVMKTFVAALTLQLADEGAIGLGDPVTRYLPEAKVARGITVAELLQHTSGIADLFTDTMSNALNSDRSHAWTRAEILKTIGGPWFAPGKGWAYSNTNYLLLGMLIERVTGSPLHDVLAARFTHPLGLSRTHLIGPGEASDDGLLDPSWASAFWGSGATESTVDDLVRWGDALYGGSLLRPETLHRMTHFNKDGYGFGTQRVELTRSLVGPGHSGLLGTYTTLLVHLPRQDITLALIAHQSHADLKGILAYHEGAVPSLLDLMLAR